MIEQTVATFGRLDFAFNNAGVEQLLTPLPDGHGVTAQKCSTCHQEANLAGAHMPPGAPHWGLPPPNVPMIWQDLTDAQICRSLKNRL